MEYPHVSILVPTYNRKQFLPIFLKNITSMDYEKEKLEVCILDDGQEKFIEDDIYHHIQQLISPISFKYVYSPVKQGIGHKRNSLVDMASHDILINMDDDDIFFPSYIKHSVEVLYQKQCGLVGCMNIIIVFPQHNYDVILIRPTDQHKTQIGEGTMCFTRSHYEYMGGFKTDVSTGEGLQMIENNENNVDFTDHRYTIFQIAHPTNTFSKDIFYNLSTEYNRASMEKSTPYVFHNYLTLLEQVTQIPYVQSNNDS